MANRRHPGSPALAVEALAARPAAPSAAPRAFWALLLLVLFALGVRGLGHLRTFHNGHVFFFGNDSWYHMRRVEFAVRHDLSLPGVDPYLNYPQGGATLWGGLFDHVAAGAALLSGAAYLDQHALETFCAWIPAVLGALCVPAMFLLGLRFYGPREALAACVFLALLPGHVQYSLLGNFDHHVQECLLFGAASAALLWLRDAAEGEARRRAFLAGGALWLLFLTHPALSCVYVGVLWAATAASVWEGRAPRAAAWSFLGPALLLLPWALPSLSGLSGVSRLSATPPWLMYEQHSFLQPLLLAFCGVSLLALDAVRRPPGAAAARAAGLWAAAAVLLAALLWPLAAGTGELFKRDPWLKYIAETRPLLVPSPQAPFDPSFAFQTFGYWFLAFPAWWVWAWRRGRDSWLGVWTGALFVLVNIQLRFMPIFAYAMALALASSAAGAWDRAAMRPGWRGILRAALVAALIAGLWPSLSWLRALSKGSRYKYLTISDQVYEMLQALKANSPPTRGYEDADQKPQYAVMAPWDFGHAIVYLAHRAVVADPFGHGVARSYRYYAAASPREALAELKDVRYVMAQDMSYPLTHRICSEYLRLPAGHPMRRGDWKELFQMKLLLDLPMKDAAGRPTTWGHRLVHRSRDGRESLYEIEPASPVSGAPGRAAGPAASSSRRAW